MPTIDELPPANSVSDSDELAVSQSDITRKATRAQLLSGVQPALAMPQNTLLGRLSAGTGAPENIIIGANLTLGNGTINAPEPFVISALPGAGPPQANDLVAVSQGGQNAAESYAAFMGGLGNLSGINGSSLIVTPTGGLGSRKCEDLFADAISIESFGALGDGVTDNTAAFLAAAQSGRPLRLDSRVYIVNGPLQINTSTAWLGVGSGSTVRRAQVTSQQPWLEFSGPAVSIRGIAFDANSLASAASPAVQVNSSCATAAFWDCQFLNAFDPTLGSGILISCGAGAQHLIDSCSLLNNGANGLSVSGSGSIVVRNCTAEGNKANGILVAQGTACVIRNNACYNNYVGISIGPWQDAASTSVSSIACLVEDNICSNNTTWGIGVYGYSASIRGNYASSNGNLIAGGGIIARVGASRVIGNQVSAGQVGIDARTSWGTLFSTNHVAGTSTGLLLGGCAHILVGGNFFITNQLSIDVTAIEPTLSFGLTSNVSISRNWIGFTLAQGGGIYVRDGCLGITVANNDFNGWGSATISQALWLHTDQASVTGNSWNNQPIFPIQSISVGSLSALIIPDVADAVLITSAMNPITSLMTLHQSDTFGQITFLRVISGGAGYTMAQAVITGTGSGATAQAIVAGGQVLWLLVTNSGSGYGPIGSQAIVSITGDGTGAAATAYVGLPALTGRHVRLDCNCQVQIASVGSPPQKNWTNYTATVPAGGSIEFEGLYGVWWATSFPATDYLFPTGDGGSILQTVGGGNLTLRPSAGGALQLASATEPNGCTTTVGRGGPNGSIVAPPGSDYRNLNGGAGSTLWIKQTGTDANGWVAVA